MHFITLLQYFTNIIMIITEIQHFSSKIVRFKAAFKSTVEFTCALEFTFSSQPFYLPLYVNTLHILHEYSKLSSMKTGFSATTNKKAPMFDLLPSRYSNTAIRDAFLSSSAGTNLILIRLSSDCCAAIKSLYA